MAIDIDIPYKEMYFCRYYSRLLYGHSIEPNKNFKNFISMNYPKSSIE